MRFKESTFNFIGPCHLSEFEIQQIIFLVFFFHSHFHFSDLLFEFKKFLVFIFQLLFSLYIFIFFLENHTLNLFFQLIYLIVFYPWGWLNRRTRLVKQRNAGFSSSYACTPTCTEDCLHFRSKRLLANYLTTIFSC